jgi:hypothetical protein
MDERDRLRVAVERWLAFWLFVAFYLGLITGVCAALAAVTPLDLDDYLTQVVIFGLLLGWRHEHRSRMRQKDQLDLTAKLLQNLSDGVVKLDKRLERRTHR